MATQKKKEMDHWDVTFLIFCLTFFHFIKRIVFFFFLFCLGGCWSSYNIVLSLWIILDSVHVCLTCVCCSRIWISTFWRMMLYARTTYNVQRTSYTFVQASAIHEVDGSVNGGAIPQRRLNHNDTTQTTHGSCIYPPTDRRQQSDKKKQKRKHNSVTFINVHHIGTQFLFVCRKKTAVHVFFPEGLFDQVKHGRHTHASIDETWDIWPALTSGSNLHQATEWNGSAKICKSPENINARHHANWFIHIHMYYSMCSWLIYVCLEAQFIGIYWMLVYVGIACSWMECSFMTHTQNQLQYRECSLKLTPSFRIWADPHSLTYSRYCRTASTCYTTQHINLLNMKRSINTSTSDRERMGERGLCLGDHNVNTISQHFSRSRTTYGQYNSMRIEKFQPKPKLSHISRREKIISMFGASKKKL